jgi:hypothetical protein
MEIPQPSRGSNILGWAASLCAYLRSERLLSGSGILVKRTPSGITLSTQPGSGGSFSGVYYFRGKAYQLTETAKEYWYHDIPTGAGVWSDDPMPDPMPPTQRWRKTSTCAEIEYIEC